MNTTLEKPIQEHPISVVDGFTELHGNLAMPKRAQAMIVLAHGNGSHRHSRFDEYIVNQMHQQAFATLRINLLTPDEEDVDMRSQHYRFDVGYLAQKLFRATEWLLQNPETGHLKVGYFSANAESAAALVAAADHPDAVQAIASRSGRVDLAGSTLLRVKTPTLLIVGSGDMPCLGMSQDALTQLHGPKRLEIIPDATHLFEEQGTLEQAIRLAIHWFNRHLIQHPFARA